MSNKRVELIMELIADKGVTAFLNDIAEAYECIGASCDNSEEGDRMRRLWNLHASILRADAVATRLDGIGSPFISSKEHK